MTFPTAHPANFRGCCGVFLDSPHARKSRPPRTPTPNRGSRPGRPSPPSPGTVLPSVWFAAAAGLDGAERLGVDAIADAHRDGDRRQRGRGQAGAVTWRDADRISHRTARQGTPKGFRDAALVALASDPCARVSEVAALRVRDVDTSTDGTAAAEIWQPKTEKNRTGYLRASTVRRLDTWRAEAGIDSGDAPLFPLDRWGRVRNASQAMQPPSRTRPGTPRSRPVHGPRATACGSGPPCLWPRGALRWSPCNRPGGGQRPTCQPTTDARPVSSGGRSPSSERMTRGLEPWVPPVSYTHLTLPTKRIV